MELELRVPYRRLLVRALGILVLALLGWWLPYYLRYPLWLSLAAVLRLGFLDELTPLRYDRGRLYRGGERREKAGIVSLCGPVVAGVWPRFGVRFKDGTRWWLPLGANWYLLWDELRRGRPELAGWRDTLLAPYFLIEAKRGPVRPEVPGELYPIAEELNLSLGMKGLAYLAGLLGYVLAQLLLPRAVLQTYFLDFLFGIFTGLLGDAVDRSLRLRAYARALSAFWAKGEGR